MASLRIRYILSLLALSAMVPVVHAQVSVAPVALFMDDVNRFGTFYVSNQATQPQEVELTYQFGYPVSDSLGNIGMQYADSAAAERYSLAPYLRSFPRQFVLAPGESQVVRLTARLPQDRPQGLYWTRLITTSTPQAALVDTTTTGVQAQIVFRVQQVTAVFYKRGNPATSLALRDLTAQADTGYVFVSAHFDQGGEAPFLGRATIQVKDDRGRLVQEYQESVSAYFTVWRRFSINVPDDLKGAYTATVTVTAERSDVPVEYQTRIPVITESVQFNIE